MDAGTSKPPSYKEFLARHLKRSEPPYNGEAVCPVCRDDWEKSESPHEEPVLTDCGHVFHKDCLLEWTGKDSLESAPTQLDGWQLTFSTCPHCRGNLFKHLALFRKTVSVHWFNEMRKLLKVHPDHRDWTVETIDNFEWRKQLDNLTDYADHVCTILTELAGLADRSPPRDSTMKFMALEAFLYHYKSVVPNSWLKILLAEGASYFEDILAHDGQLDDYVCNANHPLKIERVLPKEIPTIITWEFTDAAGLKFSGGIVMPSDGVTYGLGTFDDWKQDMIRLVQFPTLEGHHPYLQYETIDRAHMVRSVTESETANSLEICYLITDGSKKTICLRWGDPMIVQTPDLGPVLHLNSMSGPPKTQIYGTSLNEEN
ncbi:hypothetical protein BDV95DRAFT_601975 [Massariosphaeria phaeospora]|uniref:RING-type domain-containing protein n=1 Tax=Massariosphaeria phaeospora TaxID=100035 RepID=A0A7C8IEH0_9PLEO|nr:hypothetical protein BDV95DRAFT_601975 [Massariosphaeria phaeospora]